MGIYFPKLIKNLDITPESLCFCGSEKKYGDCCMKTAHESWLTIKELKTLNPEQYNGILPPSNFNKIMNQLSTKCLLCDSKTIKSHSISSNWLKKAFDSDFVSTVEQDEHENFKLKKVPINDASTFPIRCKIHDYEIFKEIDNNIDLNNEYHLNLLAYRALGREFRLQSVRTKILYSFFRDFFRTDFVGLIKEYHMRTSETYEMMKYVEYGINSPSWKGLKHKIFKIGKIEPVFLSSSISACRYKNREKKRETCMLNLLTIDNEGYFILSYKEYEKDSENLYKKINKEFKKGKIIPFLNDFIGKNCHNIICDESRAGEIIQTPKDGALYENGAHDYIRLIENDKTKTNIFPFFKKGFDKISHFRI